MTATMLVLGGRFHRERRDIGERIITFRKVTILSYIESANRPQCRAIIYSRSVMNRALLGTSSSPTYTGIHRWLLFLASFTTFISRGP